MMPSILTAEQRYWQAIRKARILARRQIEAFMRGEEAFAECTMDIERQCVIGGWICAECAAEHGESDGRN